MQVTVETGEFRSNTATVLNTKAYLEMPACRAAGVNQTLVDAAYNFIANSNREYNHLLKLGQVTKLASSSSHCSHCHHVPLPSQSHLCIAHKLKCPPL